MMKETDIPSLLKKNRLRETQPRRLVLQALMHSRTPLSPKDILTWIKQQQAAINLVTIYRILETFEQCGIVHKHPRSGGMLLCSLSHEEGHHILLSCDSCGSVEERSNAALSTLEHHIALQAGFLPLAYRSEVTGICTSCSSSL